MAMKLTRKKGLIRLARLAAKLVIFLSVLLLGWAFCVRNPEDKDFVCKMLLFFAVASCVICWLIGKLFNVD